MPNESPVLPSYMLNLPDPAEDIRKNIELAIGVQRSQQIGQAAQQDAQLKAQQIQAGAREGQLAQINQERMLELRKRFAANAANPKPDGISSMIADFPDMIPLITGASKALSQEEVKQLTPIHAAQLAGNPQVVASEYQKLAAAYQNSNDPQQQMKGKKLLDGLNSYLEKPGPYTTILGATMARDMGGEEYAKTFGKAATIQDDILKGTAEAKGAALKTLNLPTEQKDAHATSQAAVASSQASTATSNEALKETQALFPGKKLAADLSNQKTAQELGELPADTQKSVQELTTTANTAQPLARKLRNLIPLAEKVTNRGNVTKFGDFIKAQYGGQDKYDDVRNQIDSFMGSAVMGTLQGAGKASEGLIALGQQGVPDRNANMKKVVIPYLKRLADAAEIIPKVARDAAYWQTVNRGINPAKQDFTLPSGVKVKKGEIYSEVMARALPPVPPSDVGDGVQKPTADQIAAAKRAINHPGVDKAKADAARARFKAAGVDLDA